MISKTKAIAFAKRNVWLSGQGRGYIVMGPYRVADIDPETGKRHGPTTGGGWEMPYSRAVVARRNWRVEVALKLLGFDDEQASSVTYWHDSGTMEEIISAALRDRSA